MFKMKKFSKICVFFLFITLFLPNLIFAQEQKKENKVYQDVVSKILSIEPSDKIRIYFFHGNGCPHCAEAEIFFKEIEKNYKEIEVLRYEVWYNAENDKKLNEVKSYFLTSARGVPFIVIGDEYFSGFNTTIKKQMEEQILTYLGMDEKKDDNLTLPIIGDVDAKKVSLPLVAVVLGFLDGFNPCAMWILLFLINMLFTMKDKKKMWILGLSFLVTSAFVYFLAMMGLNVFLSFAQVKIVRFLIACVALLGGLLNLRNYKKTKETGCHVIDDKKRNKYFDRIKKIIYEKNFFLALLGIILLAASVNLVELACSAGFPTIFIEILNINELTQIQNLLYILLYILFFLIDDIVVFVIAMTTLKITGISTKYNRLSHLVGGILMILIGLLLIFKPEILMFQI